MRGALSILLLLLVSQNPAPAGETQEGRDGRQVRGMTISCQTWGWEWGSPGFAEELDELRTLGTNWVAIHPYASVRADGSVRWREIDPEDPPKHLANPIREAHERGLSILIKPHLAYWGSGFSWRGAIQFEEEAAREKFYREYREWIVQLARVAKDADAFCVGTELEGVMDSEEAWREIVRAVRAETPAHLTYAANWSDYDKVPFWDALDAIGLQAYFPISDAELPDEQELRRGWSTVLEELQALHRKWGKPIVFTELGYNRSLSTAARPWEYRGARKEDTAAATALQSRCTKIALEVLNEDREWLRGAFLWKWFVGSAPGENFLVDTPELRGVLRQLWTSNE